jgi:WS/DGAT C-terminal domain
VRWPSWTAGAWLRRMVASGWRPSESTSGGGCTSFPASVSSCTGRGSGSAGLCGRRSVLRHRRTRRRLPGSAARYRHTAASCLRRAPSASAEAVAAPVGDVVAARSAAGTGRALYEVASRHRGRCCRRRCARRVRGHRGGTSRGDRTSVEPRVDAVPADPVGGQRAPPAPWDRPRALGTRRADQYGSARAARLAGAAGNFRGGSRSADQLQRRIGSDRRLAIVRSDLDLAKEIAHAHRATINDVLLTAVAGGYRTLLESRGERVSGLILRAFVPISLHQEQPGQARGNVDAGMVVPLPIGEADEVRRLERIAADSAERKKKRRPPAGSMFRSVFLQRAFLRLMPRQRFMNAYVANVPGPPAPLYFAGSLVLELFPLVPITANVSIGVGALSYAGQFNITVVADRDLCPDLEVFVDGAKRSLDAPASVSSCPYIVRWRYSQRASDEGQGLGKVDGLVRVDLTNWPATGDSVHRVDCLPGDVPTPRGRPIGAAEDLDDGGQGGDEGP